MSSTTPKNSRSAPITLSEVPAPSATLGSAMNVQFGRPIPPQQQVLLYSSDEWEEFIREWVHSQRSVYQKVLRFGGANDMDIDIAGFTDDKDLAGIWVNFQCKHYDEPLIPSRATIEIGKVLWYSFNKHYSPPMKYYFVAPKGCGTSLSKMLSNTPSLKDYVIKHWDDHCSTER